MKKIIYFVLFSMFVSTYAFAQGEVEAYRMSKRDLSGTARGLSMGGAFGALGGDMTGVGINPAGIAVYRGSEIVGTFTLNSTSNTVLNTTKSTSDPDLTNFGFVGTFYTRNELIPVINFGFGYNSQYSYDSHIFAAGGGSGNTSMMDYIASVSNRFNDGKGVNPEALRFKHNDKGDVTFDPFGAGANWLSIFGYNSYLINPVTNSSPFRYRPLHNEGVYRWLEMEEMGRMNSYDFSVGMDIANKLSVGATLSVADVYYALSSQYSEEFEKGTQNGFDLRNKLVTQGAGAGAKLGLIYRPVHALRIGLAYHTPIWFVITDTFSAEMEDNVTAYVTDPKYKPAITQTRDFYNDYRFQTPDKWVVSLAGVLGSKALLSLDYELTNYKNMKFKGTMNDQDPNTRFTLQNQYITEDHKSASNVRAGMEYRFTPQFSMRLGYAWMQNPYESDYKNGLKETATQGSTTIYRIEGDTHFLTGGLGYRFDRNFYLDMAVVYKTQTDDLYPHSTVFADGKIAVDGAPYQLKSTALRGVLTLGYKF